MEERLTEVFYKVSEELFRFERMCGEYRYVRELAMMGGEVPAFLKGLVLDGVGVGGGGGGMGGGGMWLGGGGGGGGVMGGVGIGGGMG